MHLISFQAQSHFTSFAATRMTALTKSVSLVVQHALKIDDVQTKKEQTATVTSSKFSCQEEPNSGEFDLVARFGSEANFLAVSLQRHAKSATLMSFQFSVIDEGGRLLRKRREERLTNITPGILWGFKDMLALDQITGRKIVILCYIKYLPQDSIPDVVDDRTLQLQNDYIDMLESAAFADVTFLVQGEEMVAHKSVLASRSCYFKRMFEAGMQESASNRVEVTDVSPAIFRAVLRFLYGRVMEEDKFEALAELIAAADKYGIEKLKRICESAICANLGVENIIDALLVADMHNCASLLRDAKVVFKALAEILKKDQTKWNKLTKSPGLLLQLLESFIE